MITEMMSGTGDKYTIIKAYQNFFRGLSNNANEIKNALAAGIAEQTTQTTSARTLVYDDDNIGHVVSVDSITQALSNASHDNLDVISITDVSDNQEYSVHVDKLLAEYGDSCQLADVYSETYALLAQVADGASYSTADVISIVNTKYGDLTDQSRAFLANIGPVFENYDNLSVNTINHCLTDIIGLIGATEEDAVDQFELENMDTNVSGKSPIAAWFSALSIKWNVNWNTVGGVARGIGYILFKFPFDAQKQLRSWAGQAIGRIGKWIGVNTVKAPSIIDNEEVRASKQIGDYRFSIELNRPTVRKRYTHISSLGAKCQTKGQAVAIPIGPSTLYVSAQYDESNQAWFDRISICWGPMDHEYYIGQFANTGGFNPSNLQDKISVLNDTYGFYNSDTDANALYDLCVGQLHTIQLMKCFMLSSGATASTIYNTYTSVSHGQIPDVYCPYWDSLNIINRPASNLGLVSQCIDPHGTYGNEAADLINNNYGVRYIDISAQNAQPGEDVITDLVCSFVDEVAQYITDDDLGREPATNGEFVPYVWVGKLNDTRYSIASDSTNAARFANLMKTTLIVAGIIVAAVVGTKLALKFVKYKRTVLAELNGADWHVTDVYSNPASTQEEKDAAIAALAKWKKKARRLGLLKSAGGSAFNAYSSGLYSTAADGLDSLTKINDVIFSITGARPQE